MVREGRRINRRATSKPTPYAGVGDVRATLIKESFRKAMEGGCAVQRKRRGGHGVETYSVAGLFQHEGTDGALRPHTASGL